jgi:Family of unknown function (DUF5317)
MSASSVLLLLIPPLTGVCAGYATGGRLGRLISMRLRAYWLLFLAALVQASQYYVRPVRDLLEHRLGLSMLAVVFALVSAWLGVNFLRRPADIRLAGATICLGAAMNGLAILLNGRMPYSQTAARQVGINPGLVTPKNMPSGSGTRLRFLGDIIPISPLHKIVSPGDVLIVVGGSLLIALAMRQTTVPASILAARGGEQ